MQNQFRPTTRNSKALTMSIPIATKLDCYIMVVQKSLTDLPKLDVQVHSPCTQLNIGWYCPRVQEFWSPPYVNAFMIPVHRSNCRLGNELRIMGSYLYYPLCEEFPFRIPLGLCLLSFNKIKQKILFHFQCFLKSCKQHHLQLRQAH